MGVHDDDRWWVEFTWTCEHCKAHFSRADNRFRHWPPENCIHCGWSMILTERDLVYADPTASLNALIQAVRDLEKKIAAPATDVRFSYRGGWVGGAGIDMDQDKLEARSQRAVAIAQASWLTQEGHLTAREYAALKSAVNAVLALEE